MRKYTSIAIALIASVIAGCASKPHAPAEQFSAYTGPPVSLHRAQGPNSSRDAPPASALAYVNARRAEVGLPSIAADHAVAAAAASHARYVELNQSGTHNEVEGAPGFTGVDVLTRIQRHTAATGASEILAVFGSGRATESPIAEIFASPYHRSAMLFDWSRAGEASVHGSRSVTVVDFADIARTLADHELVAWPYDGQRDVPTSWTNNEQPDPMGADSRYHGQTVGYPVTLSGGPNAHIEVRTFDLRDARGTRIPCKIAPLTAADTGRSTGICTPYEPLEPATRYTVHVQGSLRQLHVLAPFDLSWSFTTSRNAMSASRTE
jgi:uncharacterized protein YkwD